MALDGTDRIVLYRIARLPGLSEDDLFLLVAIVERETGDPEKLNELVERARRERTGTRVEVFS